MTAVPFDTLKFAQTLRDKAHFTTEQAEGISQAFADATGEELATKADLEKVTAAFRLDLKETESRLDSRITDIYKWMFGQILALSRFSH